MKKTGPQLSNDLLLPTVGEWSCKKKKCCKKFKKGGVNCKKCPKV